MSKTPTSRRKPPARKSAPRAKKHAKIGRIFTGNLALHDLFQQQVRAMLDRTDLDEEQKQNILIAMSCPCCGAATMSYTAKLKR